MNHYRQLEEIISWRLVIELWRRFPERYHLIETHPGGGQSDCLSLTKFEYGFQSVLHVNRGGSVHLHEGRNPQSWPDWVDRMLADARRFLDEVEVAIGIESPKVLPKSTPTTVSYRYVCEFLTHTVGRLDNWECRNGFLDTSGYGGGKREEWFSSFPGIETVPAPKRLADGTLQAAYSYWFLLKNEIPLLCLDTDGRLFRPNGEVHNLVGIYAKHKRLWPTILETATDLLP